MIRKRKFHFKSPPLKDPAIERFNEWSAENVAFYMDFRKWLQENGYGKSALSSYGAAVRTAIGFLRKPYWTINPNLDIERVRQHLAQSERTPKTQSEYGKGLKKLAEYLRARKNLPRQEKPIPWAYTIGSLSPQLQQDIRAFLKHCQRTWKNENLFERSRDTLYGLGIPLRWMAEHAGVKDVAGLTPQVWFAWLDHRLEKNMKPATMNCDLTSLRHLVQFLQDLDRAVCEKFLLVEPLDIGFRIPKDVSLDGLRKLQAAIQLQAVSSERIGRMDLAWFLLMLHCGLRTCEVRNLKLQDIEWEVYGG